MHISLPGKTNPIFCAGRLGTEQSPYRSSGYHEHVEEPEHMSSKTMASRVIDYKSNPVRFEMNNEKQEVYWVSVCNCFSNSIVAIEKSEYCAIQKKPFGDWYVNISVPDEYLAFTVNKRVENNLLSLMIPMTNAVDWNNQFEYDLFWYAFLADHDISRGTTNENAAWIKYHFFRENVRIIRLTKWP